MRIVRYKTPRISGPKGVSVGTAMIAVPEGSRVIRKSKPSPMAYVLPPGGGLHLFDGEGREVALPRAVAAQALSRYFGATLGPQKAVQAAQQPPPAPTVPGPRFAAQRLRKQAAAEGS